MNEWEQKQLKRRRRAWALVFSGALFPWLVLWVSGFEPFIGRSEEHAATLACSGALALFFLFTNGLLSDE